MLLAITITIHTRATLTTHHTHLHCTIITPEYSNSRLHTYMYISYYVTHTHTHTHTHTQAHTYIHTQAHTHTGANSGDLQRGDQKDPYIVLKTLKFLPREWAKHTYMHTGANGGDVQRGDQKDPTLSSRLSSCCRGSGQKTSTHVSQLRKEVTR